MLVREEKEGMCYHYSDAGMKIRQIETGILYYDARDVIPCRYTYEETDIPVVEDNENEEVAE